MNSKALFCLTFLFASVSSYSQTWNLSGNAGTTSSDFIGTTDGVPLIFRINSLETARFTNDGNFLLGTTTNATYRLDVNGRIRSALEASINGILLGRGPGLATNSIGIGNNNSLSANTTGYSNIAIGTNALRYNITGHDNIAIGTNALGTDASASEITDAIAIGSSAKVGGADGISIGNGSSSTFYSIAIGKAALASTNGSLAIGRYSEAGASAGSTAIGWNSKSLHAGGVVLGYNLQTTANYQLLLGNALVGSGIRDVYIGGGVTQQLASTYGSLTIQPTGQSGVNQTGQTIRIATGKGTGTGLSGDIAFMTSTPGISGETLQNLTVSMIIKGSGNVGIGTSSPAAQLHTTGSMRFAGLSLDETFSRVLVSDATGNIAYRNVSSFGNGNILSGAINYLAKYSSENSITNSLVFENGTAVGIGTVSINDIGYKLFVESGIKTRKVKVDVDNWPDYVFNKSYKLLPLSELQAYIQTNNHLPEVPSAGQIEKEGLNLGDNQAILLKKIEELTLYLVEMNKRVDQLENQNKTLVEEIHFLKMTRSKSSKSE